MRKIALPATSAITDPAARRFLEYLREIVEDWQGLRLRDTDKLGQVLTKRDLLDLGLARSAGAGMRVARRIAQEVVTAAPVVADDAAAGQGTPTVNPEPPPAPTGLSIAAGFTNVILTWDAPESLYGNHGVSEVWRAAVDDISLAERLGVTAAAAYADARTGPNAPGYYWLRFVSKDDIEGDFNAAAGTAGATATTLDFQGVARAVNLPDPVDPQDAATQAYVDARSSVFEHVQTTPQATWTIDHPLGRDPIAIQVLDTSGQGYDEYQIVPTITNQQVLLGFDIALAGTARLL